MEINVPGARGLLERAASGNDSESGVGDEPQSNAATEKHLFSEPWEDSDLILLVEDEKFHAHRQILSIHSPVFKAMLNSQFKEGTATEIPLPGKKANQVLDFLKLLYLKETKGVTLNKMSHLLKLADEYQAQGVLDLCVKSLEDLPKSEDNAVTILFLATHTTMARNDSRLDDVREECYVLIEDMGLADIRRESDFKNLDQGTMESVLVKRTERLETLVGQAYPQLIGLVEYCIYLGLESSSLSDHLAPCPQHFPKKSLYDSKRSSKSTTALPQRIKSCSVCRKMIGDLVSSSIQSKKHFYGGEFHFDQKLISIMQNFKSIIDSMPAAVAPKPVSPPGFSFSGWGGGLPPSFA